MTVNMGTKTYEMSRKQVKAILSTPISYAPLSVSEII